MKARQARAGAMGPEPAGSTQGWIQAPQPPLAPSGSARLCIALPTSSDWGWKVQVPEGSCLRPSLVPNSHPSLTLQDFCSGRTGSLLPCPGDAQAQVTGVAPSIHPGCITPGVGPSPGGGWPVLNFAGEQPNTRTSHGKSGRNHRDERQWRSEREGRGVALQH